MESIILASAITLSILLMTALKSPKLRAIVYSLPIPITVLLIGTRGDVNVTHIIGLVLVLIFMSTIFLLYKKLSLQIILAIILSAVLYVLLGTLNRYFVNIPFVYGYIVLGLAWLIYILRPLKLPEGHYESVTVKLKGKDYLIRGAIVFAVAYLIFGLKGLIFGAAITFPFNGIFAAYIMKDHLPVFITELIRNFIGLINFFMTVYLLEGKIGLIPAILCGWVVCAAILFVVTNHLPRKYADRAES